MINSTDYHKYLLFLTVPILVSVGLGYAAQYLLWEIILAGRTQPIIWINLAIYTAASLFCIAAAILLFKRLINQKEDIT